MLLDLPRLSLCVFDTRAMLQQPISFALLVEPMAWLLLLHRLESCSLRPYVVRLAWDARR